jgi:hypothetical protein
MSSSDAIRRSATDSGSTPSDRAALIEQLLLAGLDHYFSGDYEQAIHVWTRVFFLDRGHARARAYIERARGALGERQREAEAQGLEEGAAAGLGVSSTASRVVVTSRTITTGTMGTIGESATARALVPRRFSRRDLLLGSSDVLIDDTMGVEPVGAAGLADVRDVQGDPPAGTRLLTHIVLVTLVTVLLCGAAYVVLDRDRLATWWRTSDLETSHTILTPEPLIVPRASEQALARAHALYDHGRLREAMQALAPIRVDDPMRHDADALLADIERALLNSAGLTGAGLTGATPPPPDASGTKAPLLTR